MHPRSFQEGPEHVRNTEDRSLGIACMQSNARCHSAGGKNKHLHEQTRPLVPNMSIATNIALNLNWKADDKTSSAWMGISSLLN